MRARKLLAGGVAATGLVGLLVATSWPSRCPVDLKLVGMAPSGTMDDDGSESWLVTLSISNCSAGVLFVAREWLNAEAKVANHWVEAADLESLGDLPRHGTREVLILAPFRADACRLHINYLPEPLHLRLMKLSAKLGLWRHAWYRALALRVFPVGWLEPLRSDYVGRSPHWRRMSPEVMLPRVSAGTGGPFGRAHNFSLHWTGSSRFRLVSMATPLAAAPGR